MVSWRSLSRFAARAASSGTTTNSYKTLSSRALRIEAFEDRKMFDIGATGPDLIAIIPNEGDVIQDNQTLHVAPRELLFRFEDGSIINPSTLGGIKSFAQEATAFLATATLRCQSALLVSVSIPTR